jgi:mono/diheme cytochrome c family protein
MTCHTDRGGADFAGGRPILTPFGTVYASNITPHKATGIGDWSAAHFWRALHNGRGKDGRLLVPAFPYPNYTLVTRPDADAMYHYLRSIPPVEQPNKTHQLRWPYGTQTALAVWRALYFSPAQHEENSAQSAEWNRGAYLVRGLGHCNACHSPRNALGASSDMMDLSGGLIPMQNWYAPSLASPAEAGVGDWDLADIERLLRTGSDRTWPRCWDPWPKSCCEAPSTCPLRTCAPRPCFSRPCRNARARRRTASRYQYPSGRARRQAV